MRIKRLEICGFKSFMERQVFQFDDRVTGVVGPNGCGKSNVVDSIRWVLGEQSARHLRGRAMEDVIFNGSESKSPLSMAEVTITFSNDTPELLPAQYKEFAEISVTRRLFRNGDSEYLINKVPCRLLDVSELFLGTGVGTKGYSIIEQGRIGLIVSAKPEDRRRLIEEAAGITLYQSRRKAAERKLELTEQNLVRIHDMNREMEKRLDSLGRQARKAEKYKRLKAQIRDIELHAAVDRYLEIGAIDRAAKVESDALEAAAREKNAAIEAAENGLAAIQDELKKAEENLKDLENQAHAADNAVQVGEANAESFRREMEGLAKRMEDGRNESVQLEGSHATLTEELEGLRAETASLSETTDDEVRLAEVARQIGEVQSKEKGAQADISHERALLMNLAGKLAGARSNLENLKRQKEGEVRRQEAMKAEAEGLSGRIEELEKSETSIQERLASARSARQNLMEKRTNGENDLAKVRQELVEAEVGLISLREELADKKSRLNSLKEIQGNYEGFGKAVRGVMSRCAPGVLGLVSDVVRANADVERAIEAALGDRLQTVVVESRDVALAEVERLKGSKGGRVNFLPKDLNGCDACVATGLPASASGFVGLASDLVETDEEFAPLARHLLGNTVVLKDVASAVAYLATGRKETCVTLDGEILDAFGGVKGGALEGAGVGVLHKKREIKELTAQVARLDAGYLEAQARHGDLTERSRSLDAALKEISRRFHDEDMAVLTQEKDLHKATADIAQARERLSRISNELETMNRAASATSDREAALSDEIARCEGEKGAHEARVEELNLSLTGIRDQVALLNAEMTELKVRTVAEGERREGLARTLARTEASLAELVQRRQKLENTLAQGAVRLDELKALILNGEREIEKGRAELERLNGLKKAADDLCGEWRLKATESQNVLKIHRKDLEELNGQITAATMERNERRLEVAHLEEAVAERYNTDLKLALHDYHWRPMPTDAQMDDLCTMREQIEKMGEINLTAIEECAQVEERHAAMAAQEADLEKSIHSLRKAIVRINKTSRERFRQAFDAINEKFQQLFPRLFNGGSAGLVLTEAEDGESEPGIEIMAQPPGKKLQSVNLLSGGEKALTAISLIFAIFLIKPTPFCLLDEVDAPLDEANVTRYNELIREMSQVSQFILITHNKRTMQIADSLYGVTMQEPGISTLVSVRMSRMADAANDNRSAVPHPAESKKAAVNDNRSAAPHAAEARAE